MSNFKIDILRIFSNARSYNDTNTVYYKAAEDLERYIKPFLDQLRDDPDRLGLGRNGKRVINVEK